MKYKHAPTKYSVSDHCDGPELTLFALYAVIETRLLSWFVAREHVLIYNMLKSFHVWVSAKKWPQV